MSFIDLCIDGKLDEAKLLFENGNGVVNDQAFHWACYNGHLEVAQWLWSLGGVDHHAKDDEAFRVACYSNNLPVAQWLGSLGGIPFKESVLYMRNLRRRW